MSAPNELLPQVNTDRELWRESSNNPLDPDDYYMPSIHVTEQGGIGINVGGLVIVKTLRAWHDLAKRAPTAPQGAEIAREASRSAHPDVVRLLREFHLDAMGRGHDPNHALTKLMVSGYMQKRGPEVIAALAAHDRMMAEVSAAIDAALTPTDAETKHGNV